MKNENRKRTTNRVHQQDLRKKVEHILAMRVVEKYNALPSSYKVESENINEAEYITEQEAALLIGFTKKYLQNLRHREQDGPCLLYTSPSPRD